MPVSQPYRMYIGRCWKLVIVNWTELSVSVPDSSSRVRNVRKPTLEQIGRKMAAVTHGPADSPAA